MRKRNKWTALRHAPPNFLLISGSYSPAIPSQLSMDQYMLRLKPQFLDRHSAANKLKMCLWPRNSDEIIASGFKKLLIHY